MEKLKHECCLKVKSCDSSPCQLFLTLLATNWCQYSRHILRKSPLLFMRLSHDNLLTHFLGKVPYTSWLFTIYKKIPEILVGNFGSVNTVRVAHHLHKISGLSRRASRLDSSYKMKLVRNSRNLMHQSFAAAPSPPPSPPPTADHLPALSVPGVGHLQILCCPGAGHLPTLGPFPSF